MTLIYELYRGFDEIYRATNQWERAPFPVCTDGKTQILERGPLRQGKMTGGRTRNLIGSEAGTGPVPRRNTREVSVVAICMGRLYGLYYNPPTMEVRLGVQLRLV